MKNLLLLCLLFTSTSIFSQKATETDYLKQRQQKDSLFRSSHSPLTPQTRVTFKQLPYFPANPAYRIEAVFTKNENPTPFEMKTTTSRLPMYAAFGKLSFTLNGQSCTLTVYQSLELKNKPGLDDYLLVLFTDLTSGKETYAGGRFIDFRIPTTSTVILDFNTAYNPYCAYSHNYSCPLVPAENHLKTKVPAGEKMLAQKKH